MHGHSIAIVTSSCEHSKLLFTHYVRSQDSLTSFAHSRLDNNNYLVVYFLKGVTHLFIHSEFFTFWNSRLNLKMVLNCKCSRIIVADIQIRTRSSYRLMPQKSAKCFNIICLWIDMTRKCLSHWVSWVWRDIINTEHSHPTFDDSLILNSWDRFSCVVTFLTSKDEIISSLVTKKFWDRFP